VVLLVVALLVRAATKPDIFMDHMIGRDFETGLGSLKPVAESRGRSTAFVRMLLIDSRIDPESVEIAVHRTRDFSGRGG